MSQTYNTYRSFRMITTLAYTVRSETTNNYIYIQHYIYMG